MAKSQWWPRAWSFSHYQNTRGDQRAYRALAGWQIQFRVPKVNIGSYSHFAHMNKKRIKRRKDWLTMCMQMDQAQEGVE